MLTALLCQPFRRIRGWEEPGGRVDDLARRLQCFGGLAGAGFLGRVVRVFQFVAPAAQPSEGSQASAELGADRIVNGLVAVGCGGTQALLGEQGDASRALTCFWEAVLELRWFGWRRHRARGCRQRGAFRPPGGRPR